MKKNISLFIFFLFLHFISVFSTNLKFKTHDDSVYVYQNLIQYVVPTTKLDCSYFQYMIKIYDFAYAEIKGLATEACYKPIFDTAVAQMNFILANGGCINTTQAEKVNETIVKPSVTVPAGETQIWGLNYGDAIYTRAGSAGSWVNIGGALRYLDRLPQSNGGLIWGINSASNIYYKDGTNAGWQNVQGSLTYLRISAFDKTIWGIDKNYKVYSLVQKDVASSAWVLYPNIALQYLDISPKDGAVYGISKDYRIYTTAGVGKAWNELVGLKVRYLRVISNGNLFAIDQADRKVYFKNSASSEWKALGDDYGFTFIDVNNNGEVYAIKSDGSTWYRDYVNGAWINCKMPLSTLRVLDDNSVWGLSYKDYGDQANSLIYFRESAATGWKNIPGGLITLWGPYNPNAGDSQVWGLNGGDAIYTRYSSAGAWVGIGGLLRTLDRVSTIGGGLVWGSNSAQNLYWLKGINGAWSYVSGALLTSLRISPYDLTVWGINKNQEVYYMLDTDVSSAIWNSEASVSFYYLDISPRDGSVFGISNNHKLWMKATKDSAWVEITGLAVSFVRVNAQGYLVAIEYGTGKVFYKTSVSSEWTAFGSETGFNYVDINNFGVVYGIKNDLSTWYRLSVTSNWVDTSMKLKTLRVLEDGGAWGLGWRDYGDYVNDKIYYKRDNATSWTNIAGGLTSLWGPSNILSGDHQIWAINAGDAIYTRSDPSSSGAWQNIGGALRYIDRLPTQKGGLVWGINSAKNIYYIEGINGGWVYVSGTLDYLRISPFDRTVWGIKADKTVAYLKPSGVAKSEWVGDASVSLKYLDVNPDDGSVFGVDASGNLWKTAGAGQDWSQIASLSVKIVRVFPRSKILAVGTDGKIYKSLSTTISWNAVGSESGFVFVDSNSEGIYAIKSDSTTWFYSFTDSTWTNTGLTTSTLRCLENGGVWAITPTQTIYYKKNSSSQWSVVAGALVSLWGPTNYKYF